MTNVTIYHKDYCPYCKAAKTLLKAQGIAFKAIEVTSNAAEFANMVKRSNRRTVPQIFVGETHIGGFDDLKAQLGNNTFPFNQLQTA